MGALTNNKQLYQIDALKGVAALLVCFQHAAGTGFVSGYLLAISRIAVPVFMIITGFLYQNVRERRKENSQIFKYAKIALFMFLIYFIYECMLHLVRKDILLYFYETFSLKGLRDFLLFNKPYAADHSWYLWAMIYSLLILKAFPPIFENNRVRRVTLIVTLCMQLIFGKYALVFWGREYSSIITRNIWFVGLPYVLIGIGMKKEYERMKDMPWAILSVAFIVLNCLERFILICLNVNAARDSYISTVFLAVAVFMLFYQSNRFKQQSKLVEFGALYSLPFYILHPFFVKIEVRVFNMNSLWQYVGVAFVIGGTMATIFLCNYVCHRIKRRDTFEY